MILGVVNDEVLGTSSSPIFARRKPSKIDDVESYLNYSLRLAQEWGKHWLQPIQDRLHKACPQLSQDQLNLYNDIAQSAMRLGHDLVYEMAEKESMKTSKEEWQKKLLEEYPWIDKKNVDYLYSTGMYHAMK